MIAIRVQIVRWVDDYQPGIVECSFVDRFGRERTFIEKLPYVSDVQLSESSNYPQPGAIACTVISRTRDRAGREVAEVDTEIPFSIEAIDGETRFHVLVADLIEA